MTSLSPLSSYKALIFDCDGTLADTLPLHCQVWSATFQAFGATLPQEWYYENAGLSAREIIQHFNKKFGHRLDVALVNGDRLQRYTAMIHDQSFTQFIRRIEPVVEIVDAYYGTMPLAVASGGEYLIVDATLQSLGLRHYFDTLVSVNDVAYGKPAPDVFLLAAQRLGVAPEHCLVYEDTDSGLEAAHRANMTAIDIRTLQPTIQSFNQQEKRTA